MTDSTPDAIRDVTTIGETMVAFVGRPGSREFVAVSAGAESNVAAGVAALGRRARWVSRLGDDPLGHQVADDIAGRGVDVDVVWDVEHPTGVMTKHVADGVTDRRYYRSQSAARALSPADIGRIGPTRWLHLTGITAAISSSAAELVDTLLDRRTSPGPLVSFDVNLRPALWPDTAAATERLLADARRADLVFIGDDEASTLFGTTDVDELAALILRRDRHELVLKRGDGPATWVTAGATLTEPARRVDVVDPTGAGDAFAAGWLAATCLGRPPLDRLRLGHLMASRVITVHEDVAPPFGPDESWSRP